ncbi:MAG TPA: hypothetical protein VH500_12635 [Nitrososphaeraceae archaeon]|jgi:hypothetical protein
MTATKQDRVNNIGVIPGAIITAFNHRINFLVYIILSLLAQYAYLVPTDFI